MKKCILYVLPVLCSLAGFGQKKAASIEGKAFNIGVYYLSPSRTQFDDYINTISNKLGLSGSFKPTTNIGGSFAFSFRSGKSELEAGAGLATGLRKKSSNAANTVTASLSNKMFDIHFGYSNYVGGPFFLGFDIGVVNNDGKLEQVGAATGVFESSPESSNPFKGYVFNVKPKAGFFFPFKAGEYSGFKLAAFYSLGLSKYEFYNNDIFDTRLKNYTGATKSSYSAFGAMATLVVGLDK